MIPLGYVSISEAIKALRDKGADDPELELDRALREERLPIFAQNGGIVYPKPIETVHRSDKRPGRYLDWRGVDITHVLFIKERDLPLLLGSEAPKTGAPGRPTKGMYLVLNEFERRLAADECASSRIAEAKALLDWFKKTHPHQQAPTAGTIKNKLPPSFNPYAALGKVTRTK